MSARSSPALGAVLLGLLLGGGPAAAQPSAPAPPTWGVAAHVGAAIDRGGFVVGLAARARLSSRVTLGVAAEFAPFFDLLAGTVAPGVANAYGTFRFSWFSTPSIALHSSAHAGASVLLFEQVGTRPGSVGFFVGLSLLGVTLELTPQWSLELVPEVTLEVPSLAGVPFVYRQYRLLFTVVRWL